MNAEQEYLYGWLFYLLGVVVVMGCGWLLTARLRNAPLRHLLRVLAAAILLTPWYAAPDLHYLAPAWIIAAFEGLFDGEFLRAGAPLLWATGACTLVYLSVYALWCWRVKKGRKPAVSDGELRTATQKSDV